MSMSREDLLDEIIRTVRSNGVGGLTTAAELRTLLAEIVNSAFDGLLENSQDIAVLANNAVLKTGNQTVNGVKTFVAPVKIGIPTDDDHAATKKYVDDLFAGAGNTDLSFNGNRTIKRQINGLEGLNIGGTNLKEVLENLLYPKKAPNVGVSLSVYEYEMGDNSNILVSWSATQIETDNITKVTVNGVDVGSFPGASQNGTLNIARSPLSDTVVTVVGYMPAAQKTAQATAKVLRAYRIGGSTNSGQAVPHTDEEIRALNRFLHRPNSVQEFKVTLNSLSYLVISVPEILNSSPTFFINGLRFNDFTVVRNSSSYTNTHGFTDTVDVYVSNNQMKGDFTVKIL